MSSEAYPIIYQQRLNPEFIGIAEKYSSFKKSRLSLEQKRNKLIQSLKYKMSVDRKLSHSLDQNQEKLKIVQGVNYRHQKQLTDKRQNQLRKRKQLNELNQTIQATRSENKKNIRDALLRNYTKKRRISSDTSKMIETLTSQMRQTFTNKFQEKRSKFKQIQSQKKQGRQTIKEFHLQKNADSLNNYKNLIEHQEDIANQFKGDIQVIESTIDKYDSKIERKKKNLIEVMKKISLYTLQPVESQQKSIIPLYLRDMRATTSHSSRPSDILLRGPKNIILSQSLLPIEEQK